jgi:hypothetical protein
MKKSYVIILILLIVIGIVAHKTYEKYIVPGKGYITSVMKLPPDGKTLVVFLDLKKLKSAAAEINNGDSTVFLMTSKRATSPECIESGQIYIETGEEFCFITRGIPEKGIRLSSKDYRYLAGDNLLVKFRGNSVGQILPNSVR